MMNKQKYFCIIFFSLYSFTNQKRLQCDIFSLLVTVKYLDFMMYLTYINYTYSGCVLLYWNSSTCDENPYLFKFSLAKIGQACTYSSMCLWCVQWKLFYFTIHAVRSLDTASQFYADWIIQSDNYLSTYLYICYRNYPTVMLPVWAK